MGPWVQRLRCLSGNRRNPATFCSSFNASTQDVSAFRRALPCLLAPAGGRGGRRGAAQPLQPRQVAAAQLAVQGHQLLRHLWLYQHLCLHIQCL